MLTKIKTALRPSFLKSYFKQHKKKSMLFIVLLIAASYGVVRIFAGGSVTTTYGVAQVKKGDIVSTVSASGQVSATNEVELKSKNSGDLISVKAIPGQEVKAGTIIAQVEAKDAYYSYQSAKIAYDKLLKPADTLTTLQAQNSLDAAKSNLTTYYAEAKSDIDDVFIDAPKIIEGLNAIYYTNSGTLNSVDEISLSTTARSYKSEAGISFDKARRDFESSFAAYKSYGGLSSTADTEKLIDSTYAVVSSLAQAVKGTKNTLDYLQSNNMNAKNLATAQSDTNGWLAQLNSHLSKLVTVKNNINTANKSIVEKQTSVIDVQAGTDDLDLQSARLTLQQRASAYADSYIKAPFDGVIAKVDAKKGDNVSSGAVIGTLITKQKIVTVDLNEVDISKIKTGQSADITFDAIDNLTATGTVVSVDSIGTTAQGVVSYSVKIALNTADSRILSGMSASATINTESQKDVIAVATAAIKTQGKRSYVEVVTDANIKPGMNLTIDKKNIERRFVELGLADETKTEIVSGLDEGELIIIRTNTSAAAKTTTTTAPSLFGGQGGGAVRTGAGAGGGNRTFNR